MATNIHDELAALRAEHLQQRTDLASVAADLAKLVADSNTQLSAKVDAILAKLSATSPTPIPAPVLAKLRIMIVTYFRNDAYWASTIAVKPPFVQINPGNGDATTADSLYVKKVPELTALGIPVYIYTHTRYGKRPEAEVLAAVTRQKGFYPQLQGVFVDTVANGHGDPATGALTADQAMAYYSSLVPKLKALGLEVCLNLGNVGAKTPEALPLLGKFAMTREMTAANYMAFTPLPWELKPEYAGRFWHVAHGCSLADMPGVVARMARNGAGLATVTDDAMGTDGNPYNMPPSYIPQLDAACKAIV